MKKAVLVLVFVAALVGAGYFAYRQFGPSRTSAASNAQTVAVQRGTLLATVSAAGNLTPRQQLNLNFPLAGTVTQVNVNVGDRVKAGQVLAQLDTSDLDLQVKQAQTNLLIAQINLAKTKQGPTAADLASAQAQLVSAQAGYSAAKSQVSSQSDTLTAVQLAVQTAQVSLQQAQAAYDHIAWKPGASATSQAVALQQATIAYQTAVANYNAKVKSTDSSALQQAAAQVSSAQAAIDKLQPTEQDIALAQANVDNAQVALDQANLKLKQAQIAAPFNGVVTAVNITQGQSVGSGGATAAIQLADLDNLEIVVNMAEVDMTRIKLNQEADITLDALPNVALKGTVTSISPAGVQTQGVVNYPVTISLQKPAAAVESGMTANINVVINRRDNALTVPNRAIQTRGQQRFVTVLFEGQMIQTPVTTGLSNDTSTEITSGLQEGDEIVLNQTTTTQAGRVPGVPGGGGPGGAIFVGGRGD